MGYIVPHMYTLYYIILAVSTFLFAGLAVYAAYVILNKYELFDAPTERSNHANPVPTGAGIAFILVALGFLIVANAPENLLWGTLILCLVGFIDDMRGVPIVHRFGVQCIAVLLAMGTVQMPLLQGIVPLWLDYPIMLLLWLWFINLFNFMDGIDEISVMESAAIAAGIAVLGFTVPDIPRSLAIDAVIIIAAVLAFYPWNRHPAALFMGDAGSLPLGFLMGYLLLSLAGHGYWEAALILPAYYLTDATVTLGRRVIKRQAPWQAHSEHFYQKAVRAGRSHAQVAHSVLTVNIFLVAFACLSVMKGPVSYAMLALAYAMSVAFCVLLARPPKVSADEMAA